jgi:hypothetical protein
VPTSRLRLERLIPDPPSSCSPVAANSISACDWLAALSTQTKDLPVIVGKSPCVPGRTGTSRRQDRPGCVPMVCVASGWSVGADRVPVVFRFATIWTDRRLAAMTVLGESLRCGLGRSG